MTQATSRVRSPAVAGLFYPADAPSLRRTVQECVDGPVRTPVGGGPPAGDGAGRSPSALRGVVVPHAGYVYSGATAGLGYRLLDTERPPPRLVLLLGPAHFVPVDGLSLSSADLWRTPLGDVPLDAQGRDLLLERGASSRDPVRVDDEAHQPEHSLEVQLPFVQTVLPGVPVLPVLVGRTDPGEVADLLSLWWDDPRVVVVVSTDLSHYEPDASARAHDARTAAAVLRSDAGAIGDRDACGARPLRVLLTLAARGPARVRQLGLATSADTGGSPRRVVGYGAFSVEQVA